MQTDTMEVNRRRTTSFVDPALAATQQGPSLTVHMHSMIMTFVLILYIADDEEHPLTGAMDGMAVSGTLVHLSNQ